MLLGDLPVHRESDSFATGGEPESSEVQLVQVEAQTLTASMLPLGQERCERPKPSSFGRFYYLIDRGLWLAILDVYLVYRGLKKGQFYIWSIWGYSKANMMSLRLSLEATPEEGIKKGLGSLKWLFSFWIPYQLGIHHFEKLPTPQKQVSMGDPGFSM